MISLQKMSALVLLSLSFGTALAQSNYNEVIIDKDGMPLCIVNHDESQGFIRLIWNKDSFEKEVFYEQFDHGQKSKCYPKKRVYLKDKFPAINTKKIEWQASGKRMVLPAHEKSLFIGSSNMTLSLDAQNKLDQVRLGGNVQLNANELTPADYIVANPIENFTVELNREITVKHGAGFSAGVYKTWLDTQPENAEFKEFILKGLNNKSGMKKIDSEYTTVFVKGFGHSLGGNDRYQPFIDSVRIHGLDMRVIYTEPYGRTPDNTEAIKMQLNELLAQGKKLIVVCGSNGCLQLLAAMSDLHEKLEVKRPEGYGRIDAMLSLSGVFYGSFAADWGTEGIKWQIVKKTLHQGLHEEGIDIPKYKLDSFKDLRMDFVSQYVEDHSAGISQKIKFFNVIGVPQYNGLVKDPEIGLLQTKSVRPHMEPGFGANDGYIEFPGTTFDKAWSPEVYTVALDSSHAVLDGNFEGISMQNGQARDQLIGGLLDFILTKVK